MSQSPRGLKLIILKPQSSIALPSPAAWRGGTADVSSRRGATAELCSRPSLPSSLWSFFPFSLFYAFARMTTVPFLLLTPCAAVGPCTCLSMTWDPREALGFKFSDTFHRPLAAGPPQSFHTQIRVWTAPTGRPRAEGSIVGRRGLWPPMTVRVHSQRSCL